MCKYGDHRTYTRRMHTSIDDTVHLSQVDARVGAALHISNELSPRRLKAFAVTAVRREVLDKPSAHLSTVARMMAYAAYQTPSAVTLLKSSLVRTRRSSALEPSTGTALTASARVVRNSEKGRRANRRMVVNG
jgi:hypothetical protein